MDGRFRVAKGAVVRPLAETLIPARARIVWREEWVIVKNYGYLYGEISRNRFDGIGLWRWEWRGMYGGG